MTIFTIAGTVTLLLCSLPAVSHLQQCAYRTDKSYFKIFKSGYFVLLCVVQTASLLLLFLADRNAGDGMCVLLLCVVAVLTSRANRKSNKPLKFTARVIRLLSVQTCLYCVLCILVGVCYVAVFLPVITAIASLVCVPVEKAISAKYLKSAVAKLKDSPAVKIAVTGSYGKTSVKNILSQLLDCDATPFSYNTPMGIARYINDGDFSRSQYIVLEFGARHRGDISRLCRIASPDISVISGITAQHLETFKSIDAIIDEKGSVIDFTSPDGFCVINGYSDFVDSYADRGKCRKVFTGKDGLRFTVNGTDGGDKLVFDVFDGDRKVSFCSPLLSLASVENIVCALQVCSLLGHDIADYTGKVASLKQIPHRMEVIHAPQFTVIDDCYNANIRGVESCCKTLELLEGNKVAISQGIVEGGKDQSRLNVECGKLLGRCCEYVIVTGINGNDIACGVSSVKGKTLLADTLSEAVTLVGQLPCQVRYVLFQNDIPTDATKL